MNDRRTNWRAQAKLPESCVCDNGGPGAGLDPGPLDGAGLVSEPNPDAFPSGRELRRESSLGASTKLSTEVGVDGKSGHTPYL